MQEAKRKKEKMEAKRRCEETRKNADLRQAAKVAGVYLWQIAQLWGKSEPYMTRFMRRDLTEEQRQQFLSAIDQLKAEQA